MIDDRRLRDDRDDREPAELTEEMENEGFRYVGASSFSFTDSTTRELNSALAPGVSSSSDETLATSSFKYSFSSAGKKVEMLAPLFHFYGSAQCRARHLGHEYCDDELLL